MTNQPTAPKRTTTACHAMRAAARFIGMVGVKLTGNSFLHGMAAMRKSFPVSARVTFAGRF
jgi:hypothetical protein